MKIIALGSNIPFKSMLPIEILETTYKIMKNYNINIIKKSHIYQSEAYPNKSDPLFYNSALSIETKLTPYELLENILKIEKLFGSINFCSSKSFFWKNFRSISSKIPHPSVVIPS